ncbi:MAG TPA: DUF885 domain-containing protein [Gemmatimonadales bacterium]|nr:DUF885 domain-containing protein [Gemmatimonadales bacterium]
MSIHSTARWPGAVVVLLAACAPAAPGGVSPIAADSLRFEKFIDSYLEEPQAREEPRAEQILSGLEVAEEAREAASATKQLQELRSIDTTRLVVDQRIDWLLIESVLERQVYDTVLHRAERSPGNYLTLGSLFWRVAGDHPPTASDWSAVRSDLEIAPRALAIGRRQLKAPPPLWVRLAITSSQRFSEFLRGDFRERVGSSAPDSMRTVLLTDADQAVAALDGYAAFLKDTLAAGPEGSWATGKAYYDWVLEKVNFLPFTADSLIAEGRRIHAETKLALDSLAKALRPGTDWHVLTEELRSRHPEPGAITDAYRRQSHKVQALLIRDDLIRLPPCQELVFVPTPPQLRDTYAWGGYGGLTDRDGVKVGRFFVTDVVPGMTPDEISMKLRAQNNGWISVIALHEGYPGHHLQAVYTAVNPRKLRRHLDNTYYDEGWALYSEHWMGRAGLYDDNPDARLAQLQMRLWRTARVIIDPSLHTGAMTYEQAVQFFVDEVGLERSAAEAEVNRFTTWPTQAPSYIIGWLELERLKTEIQAAVGNRFTEKQYVERVLEAGPLPLALLRRAVLAAYGLGPDAPPRPASP